MRGPPSRVWYSKTGSGASPTCVAFFRTPGNRSVTDSAWRTAMADEAVAVCAGCDGAGGGVVGGPALWPSPPYLHGSRARAADLAAARKDDEPVARVYQDLRLPVQPGLRHNDVGRAVRAAPAGAPLRPRPMKHPVEASEDLGSHQADDHLPTPPQEWLQLGSAWSPCPSSISMQSCGHCSEPPNLNCSSGCCECHVSFLMPKVYCKIRCEGTGHGCAALMLLLQVECGAAGYPAHEGRGSVPFLSFSTRPAAWRGVCQCGDADPRILALLEVFMQGSAATILTPVLLQYHFRMRPRTLCFWNYTGFYVLQIFMSGCYTSSPLQAAVHAAFAIFVPLGLNRWRRARASLKLVLRFSGEDICVLSSVMHPLDLQLNPSPHMRLPTRLLVEPLALRLARLQEALEEYNCRYCASGFSPDLLAGSFCILLLRQHGYSVASRQCVHLGTSCVNSDLQSMSCNLSCVVIVFLS